VNPKNYADSYNLTYNIINTFMNKVHLLFAFVLTIGSAWF